MITRTYTFVLLLVAAVPLWSQRDAVPTSEPSAAANDSQMLVPPPVSAESYPTITGSEVRSNYLRTGVAVSSTYTDNLLGGISARPITDESYSILPFIALDQTTARLHSILKFNPGFTFYQRTSGRNQADENASLNVSYRLSPHVTMSLVDSFLKSSNLMNQFNGFNTPVFGSGQVSPVTVFAPVADQLSNTGAAQLRYQFGLNAMVGVSGTFTNLHYSNPAEVPGLYDSGSRGGSVFYTHRLSGRHYIGIPNAACVSSRVSRADHYQWPDALLFSLSGANNFAFVFWRAAIFKYARIDSAHGAHMVAGNGCESRLARAADQFCAQLFAADCAGRRPRRGGASGRGEIVNTPATYPRNDRRPGRTICE